MPNNTGKPGTLTEVDFTSLYQIVDSYKAQLVATKVAKLCMKKAAPYLHEYPESAVGKAYASVAQKITDAVGTSSNVINRDAFHSLSSMVDRYGPEVIIQKLGKIARRQSNELRDNGASGSVVEELRSLSDSLKGLFPRQA